MSLFFPFIAILSVSHLTGSNGSKGLSQVPEKKNQLFGKTDNLLRHFE